MTSTTENTAGKLAYALHLINKLPNVVRSQTDALETIQQNLTQLEGRTCTGREHWRDKNTPGKTAKLYILHGTDQACPIHGTPEPGQRNRAYIGNKPDKIAEALAAIERETERQDLQRDLNNLVRKINRVTWEIKSLYRNLDHIPPALGGEPTYLPDATS